MTIIAAEDALSLKSTQLFCCYNTLNSNKSTLHYEDMESSIFMSNVPYINLNVEHSNHLNVGNGPFPQDCDDAVISIVNHQKVFIFIYFFLNVCTFITVLFVLNYLCIKLQKNSLR